MLRLRILKTYFLEILLVFSLAIMATIITLSWFLNTHFEKSTSTMVNTLNQEFLAETHRINNYLQKVIKISGMELFLEPSIQKLMYQEELANFDVVTGIRRLDAVMSTNIHTHSIYVYNAQRDYIFTTSNLDSNHTAIFGDRGAMDLLTGSLDHRRLAPIPRYIPSINGDIPIYSFVFYTIQNSEPKISGALIMNISIDWLREAFQDTVDSNSQILFVDTDGTVAYHSDTSQFLLNIADTPLFQRMVENEQPNGYFLYENGKEKSFVFYSRSVDSPLYLMRIFPYDVIMEGIIDVRASTLLLILLCIGIALLLGFLASRRLYKPINELVSRVETQNKTLLQDQGELRFLSSSIDQMLSKAQTSDSYRKLLQEDILREILTGKIVDPSLVEQQFSEYGFPFSLDTSLQLLAIKPYNEETIQACKMELDQNACNFVQFDHERLLIITQRCQGPCLQVVSKTAFETGAHHIVVARKIEHPVHLAHYANLLLEELKFSFIHPTHTVLDVRHLKRSTIGGTYPTDLEKTLLRFLHQGRSDEAFSCYQEFFDQVAKNSFTHFRFSMKRLYISIQLLITELKESECFSAYKEMGITKFEAFIEKLEDKNALDTLFVSWFKEFEEELQRCKAAKNLAVVNHIKEIVEAEYQNPNLCLQFIADAVQLSVSYVSKLFKENEGKAISDYCLERRMQEAVRLLIETEVLVKEIALSIGFLNENYFFTVFKKQYGMTPNEYRRQARLKNPALV